MTEDHPHAYGDKSRNLVKSTKVIGSSPRVWGQVYGTISATVIDRIIPTRMGTRGSTDVDNHQGQDHPHAYGDKWQYSAARFAMVGSSPRVWGQG